jgi:carbamoyltransferase
VNVLGLSGLDNGVAFKRREWPHLDEREYRFAQGFDSAAALVTHAGVAAAAAEERFRREKTTGAFPIGAARFCLAAAGLAPHELDAVAHGFRYAPYAPFFASQGEIAARQYAEVYSEEAQRARLREHFPEVDLGERLVAVPHHLAHAASAYFQSGFDDALVLVCDAMGEMHSTSVFSARGPRLDAVCEIPALHSLGLLYGLVTHHLGFSFARDEYKVMGLAPHGDARRHFAAFEELLHLREGGTYAIPFLFADAELADREAYRGPRAVLARLLGPARAPGEPLEQHHADVAAALQASLQRCLLHVLAHFRRRTGHTRLCMAGGVALNCTANGVIHRSGLFEDLFVQPAAGDDGSALGAALWLRHTREPERWRPQRIDMPDWGPEFDDAALRAALRPLAGHRVRRLAGARDLAQSCAELLDRGAVVGWFQGRMEFGPRALGNRSLLADPRDAELPARLNARIKQRESFRPFAPVVTHARAAEVFDLEPGSEPVFAHMLATATVRSELRAKLPAITHVDGSARVQVLARGSNERLYALLEAFERRTGWPVLLNTSFNVRSEPIVCTPAEAVATYERSGIEALALGDYLVTRAGGAAAIAT